MRTRNDAVIPVTSILVAMLLSLSVVHAAPASVTTPDAKALTMGQSAAPAEKLKFNVEALKKSYKINEPIRLKLNGDKDFYLYLYSLNEDGGATQVFPNRKQKNNHFAAGRTYVMPGSDTQPLTADKGNTTERLMVVASLKKLDFDYEASGAGDYYSDMQKQLQSKDIRWGTTADQATGRDTVTRTLSLKISNQRYTEADNSANAANVAGTVLLGADKKSYKAGETMRIMYASSADGVLTLAYEYEDGARQLLKRTRVKAGELNSVKAQAEAPGGKHTLLAWMDSGTGKAASDADDYYDAEDAGDKDIRVAGAESRTAAREVARFVIQVKE
ncbi:MAG: DUF4384 domain-containing protein [Gallionella sp.]|nr:DUF4384 domain-containing protein [Gallionella sp.]